MTDFEIILLARGQELKRYISADNQEQAEQAIRDRFPYDPVTIVLVRPGVTKPFGTRDRLDGLGVQG